MGRRAHLRDPGRRIPAPPVRHRRPRLATRGDQCSRSTWPSPRTVAGIGRTGIDKRPATARSASTSPAPGGSGVGRRPDRSSRTCTAAATRPSTPTRGRTSTRWSAELGRPLSNGTFGENLTTSGLDVTGALIGERWRIGAVELEVSAPRIPCTRSPAGWTSRSGSSGSPSAGAARRVPAGGRPGAVEAGDADRGGAPAGHGVTIGVTFRALTTRARPAAAAGRRRGARRRHPREGGTPLPAGGVRDRRLAIDLGTSHTVAVVERAGQPPRPLLFDGSPLLPSGVFAAAGGALHTGRDAERLAQMRAAPVRAAPEAAHRRGHGAARRRRVPGRRAARGRAAPGGWQEAGPSAGSTVVLTCPADWGRLRRVGARRGAPGGPASPTRCSSTSRSPPPRTAPGCSGGHVPAGQSLLVFDFGGGTLDLALVRLRPGRHPGHRRRRPGEPRRPRRRQRARRPPRPDRRRRTTRGLWQRLQRPSDPAELRDRRMFWDEVRAAKEMLSRTTRAPVPVPGGGDAVAPDPRGTRPRSRVR